VSVEVVDVADVADVVDVVDVGSGSGEGNGAVVIAPA
jgi:hypothetical protein